MHAQLHGDSLIAVRASNQVIVTKQELGMRVISNIAMGAVKGFLFAGMAIAYVQLVVILLVVSGLLLAAFAP